MRDYFLPRRWRLLASLAFTWFGVGAHAVNADAPVSNQGSEALRAALREEQLWVKVHAAEALVLEGQGEVVREWIRREPTEGAGAFPRIGRWRLQVRLGGSEREAALSRIEGVFLDPAGPPDALQAVESLCKLRAISSPKAAAGARKLIQTGVERDQVFAHWFLALVGIDGETDWIIRALESGDEVTRLRAGYALRWLGEKRPTALAKLAAAADREPAASATRPYLIGSAYRLRADSTRMPAWRAALFQWVAKSDPAACYDVAQALMDDITPAELTRWQPLLSQKGDNRIAAGWVFLHVANRQTAQH